MTRTLSEPVQVSGAVPPRRPRSAHEKPGKSTVAAAAPAKANGKLTGPVLPDADRPAAVTAEPPVELPILANGGRRARSMLVLVDLPEGYRPSEKEPFMGDLQRLYFRRKLVAWRDEILHSTRETLQSLHDDQAHYADIADRATSESDKALELRARDRQRKLIAKIEAAMERIDRGTYGYCVETGEPIGLKRLDARPIATLSIEAQERHERRERVYRDD